MAHNSVANMCSTQGRGKGFNTHLIENLSSHSNKLIK